ncbi:MULTISPECIES: hypothetical protein [unclassified Clostridium]|uniref:hypothetical protein n=1 Tax=unclassified Clostridium TaxID=2614128 RepID=UPI00338ED314
MVEKPSIEDAPSNTAILGKYIVTSKIFEILDKTKPGKGNEIQITDVLLELVKEESRIVSKKDIGKYGLLTFFYSDASLAVNTKIYRELNAYDGKDMPTNEDMYFAHKLIHAGYRIKYCADSEVYHSHDFTFKQLYNRYFDTGVLFKENSYLMKYKGNESGLTLAKYVFKRALEDRNIKVAFSLLPNFGVRYIAMKRGQK